jgi:hypothetical protein
MSFLKTIENLKTGPLGWNAPEDIFSTQLGAILNKPHLAPEFGTGEMAVVSDPSGTTETLTFTAPETLTLRNLVIFPVSATTSGEPVYVTDPSYLMTMGRLSVVSGTGPDVGLTLFEGTGAGGMGVFGIRNVDFAPKFNIRMDAGDVLELDVVSIAAGRWTYAIIFTYERGIDSTVSPKRFIGGASSPTFFGLVGGSVAASATLTVAAAPTTDTVQFIPEPTFEFANITTPTLSGTSGGSSSEYDSDIAVITDLRDDILTVLSNSANDFDDNWTFASSGSDAITVTRSNNGAGGNFDLMIPSGTDLTVTSFSGGISPNVTVSALTPTSDYLITDIYAYFIEGATPHPATSYVHGFEIIDIEIDSSPITIGRACLPPQLSMVARKQVNVPVSSGQTVDIIARYSGAAGGKVLVFLIAADAV